MVARKITKRRGRPQQHFSGSCYPLAANVLAERREPSGFGAKTPRWTGGLAPCRSIDKVLTSDGPVGSRQTADDRLTSAGSRQRERRPSMSIERYWARALPLTKGTSFDKPSISLRRCSQTPSRRLCLPPAIASFLHIGPVRRPGASGSCPARRGTSCRPAPGLGFRFQSACG